MLIGSSSGSQLLTAPSRPRHFFSTASQLLAFITGQGRLLAQHQLRLGRSDQFHPAWPPPEPPSHNTSPILRPHLGGQLDFCSFGRYESGRRSEGHVSTSPPALSGLGSICAPTPATEGTSHPGCEALEPRSPGRGHNLLNSQTLLAALSLSSTCPSLSRGSDTSASQRGLLQAKPD